MRLDRMLSEMKIATKEINKWWKRGLSWMMWLWRSLLSIYENNDVVKIWRGYWVQKVFVFCDEQRKGVTSHSKDPMHKTVIDDMGELYVFDLNPVGRLDLDTTGLLIITNDGKLLIIWYLRKKCQEVQVTLRDKVDEIQHVWKRNQAYAGRYHHETCDYGIIDDYNCYLTIKEGKYHQVKRMFEKVGNEVVELKRSK